MPRELDDDSDWAEDDSDESPDEGFAHDDDEPTVPCPYCRREILEDAERCPYCENYISAEDAPPVAKPLWIIAGAVACLLAICWWFVA
jgi:hypothetical protein